MVLQHFGLATSSKDPRLACARRSGPVPGSLEARTRAFSSAFLIFSALFVVLALPTQPLAQGAFEVRPDLVLPSTLVLVERLSHEELFAQGREADAPIEGEVESAAGETEVAYLEDDVEGQKSPGKAFVFSMLAPGSGQLYAGSKTGFIYLGVEAIAWTSSYFLWKSGKQKEDEFMDYADEHWVFPLVGSQCGDAYYDEKADSLIRYFYENDKGHFYEDIGKYQVYLCGWDTGTLGTYLDLRDDSNRLLKGSNYAIMAALVNHVISAVDALRLARYHNMRLGYGVDLDIKLKAEPHSRGVMLVASRKF
jgi:hypothetical protein